VTERDEELAKLSAVPLFEDLSKRELSRLYRESTIVNHEEGHTIVTEGRGAHGFHLIRSGTAPVVRNGRVLTHLGPGQFFGELALFDTGPRTATIVSETPLQVLVVSRSDFRRVGAGKSDVGLEAPRTCGRSIEGGAECARCRAWVSRPGKTVMDTRERRRLL